MTTSFVNNTPDLSNPQNVTNCSIVIDLSRSFPASIAGIAVGVPLGTICGILLLIALILFIRDWRMKSLLKMGTSN